MSDFDLDNAGIAVALVFAAAFSTVLGAAIVFERRLVKLASKPVLAAGLGFSSGVMVYVSFIEIFTESLEHFRASGRSEDDSYFCATLCLFGGMVLLRLIEVLIHMIDPAHDTLSDSGVLDRAREFSMEVQDSSSSKQAATGASAIAAASVGNQQAKADLRVVMEEAIGDTSVAVLAERQEEQLLEKKAAQLQMMGMNTALAIAIHNFPEGIATFVATLQDPSVGATLAIAIGVHNIPEGLCVALPIYYATGSRLKGFLWALVSGASEPFGALIGWIIIKSTGSDMSEVAYGILFGIIGGIMIMIVLSEILPTAFSFDPKDRYVTNSILAGMAVMASSLCLFRA